MMLELEKLLVQEQFKLMTLKTIDQVKFYESIGFVLKSKTKSLIIGQRRQIQNEVQLNNNQMSDKANQKFKKSNDTDKKSNSFDPPPLPPLPQTNHLYEYHMEKSI